MSVDLSSGGLTLSFKAGADLSAKQFYFVKMSANDTVALCSGATDKPIGVLQNKPTSGQIASVMVIGVTKVSSDAALAVGDIIATQTDGQAEVADSGDYVCGHVIIASGAAGGLATAVISCSNLSAKA